MWLKYDLHIHTALSPCALEEMTPNNIVNMAILNKLDVIAITDHNACGNVAAVMDVANKGQLLVIPGIEIETKEEIHVLCFFKDLVSAYRIQEIVNRHLPTIPLNSKLFGEQNLYDKADTCIGQEKRLLTTATQLTLQEVANWVREYNGMMIPAHIDRPSYSLIANLGFIPEGLKIRTLEISKYASMDRYKDNYKDYQLIQSSDAHELGYIGICGQELEVEAFDVECILSALGGHSDHLYK